MFTQESRIIQHFMLCDIVEYIEGFRGTSKTFNMKEIRELYNSRLISLECEILGHTTRLRQSIVESISDISCVRNTIGIYSLVFDAKLTEVLSKMDDPKTHTQR